MTIVETLRNKLRDWTPDEGRQTLVVKEEDQGCTVELTADRKESLGCEVWELTVQQQSEESIPLKEWAQTTAERVSGGLMETLELWEFDQQQDVAVLRSSTPSRQENDVYYYEAQLQSTGKATVKRYHAEFAGKGKREQIDFTLTHEAIVKLVDDLLRE